MYHNNVHHLNSLGRNNQFWQINKVNTIKNSCIPLALKQDSIYEKTLPYVTKSWPFDIELHCCIQGSNHCRIQLKALHCWMSSEMEWSSGLRRSGGKAQLCLVSSIFIFFYGLLNKVTFTRASRCCRSVRRVGYVMRILLREAERCQSFFVVPSSKISNHSCLLM